MRRFLALAPVLVLFGTLGAAPVGGAQPSQRPQVAVLAGGCFWGMEAVFEHVKGVRSVVSGYAGGKAVDAFYSKVSSERTGHAEAVRILYDPRLISYQQLLHIYFTAAHDPTELNRQGPDVGPSYRSAIFPQTPIQRAAAMEQIARFNGEVYRGRIVTKIENGKFYPAEDYHQDFMRRNPRHPYILQHDVSKLARLKALFPSFYR